MYSKLLKKISKINIILIIILAITMTVSVSMGVFYRYILRAPLRWPEELARYLMIAITYLGSAIAFRERKHAKLSFVMERLPSKAVFILKLFGDILVLLFLAFVVYESSKLAFIEGPAQTSPGLRISMMYAFVAIPIGSSLMILQIIENMKIDIKYFMKTGKSYEFDYLSEVTEADKNNSNN